MSRSNTSAAVERGVKATTSRHINLFWPWILWAAMWIFTEGTYLLFHYALPDYLPWMAVFTTLAGVGVSVAVWKMSASRIESRRDTHAIRGMIFATGTAAAAAFWAMAGMIGNPFSPGLAVTWGFGGLVVVVLWNIRMVMERSDAKAAENGQPTRRGAAAALIESVTGDSQISASVGYADDERIDLHVDLTESDLGQQGLQGIGEKLAAAVGRPAHSGVVMPDPNHAGRATARILLKDVLTEPLPWPGPACPGGTPFDPIEKGRYITGDPARFCVADQSGVRQKCTVGQPRVGKGNGMLIELGNAMTWRETTIIGVDVRKGFQTFEPIVPALDMLVRDKDEARALLTSAIDRLLVGRFNKLGVMGEPVWQPGIGMQFLWLQIEEASYLDLPDEYMERIGKSAGSVGVHIDWSLQSTLYTQMSTTLRRMFSTWAVYGCQDDFEAGNLPDELRMAGADPAKWRDEHPGMNYLSTKGIPRAQQATELRDYLPTRSQLAELSATWGSQPLDKFSADLLGSIYHNRVKPSVMLAAERQRMLGGDAHTAVPPAAPMGRQVAEVTPAAVAVLDRDDDGEPIGDDYDYDGTEVGRLTPEELGIVTEYEGLPMELSLQDARELPLPPGGEDVQIGDPADRGVPGYQPDEESVAWVRAAVDEQLALWDAEGRRFIRPADFVDTELCGPLGPRTRGRTWFVKECKRLTSTGRLQYDDSTGKYMIVPPAGPAN
jgi:hypothetical protein